MDKSEPKIYKHGGLVFEFYTLPVTGTILWVASGHLKSDPETQIRTKTFDTELKAEQAFIGKAREMADRQKS